MLLSLCHYNHYITNITKSYGNFTDLFNGNDYVTDEDDLDSSLHSALLFQTKAEEYLVNHSKDYPGVPLFLYYSLQLVHSPFTAPEIYLQRCTSNYSEAFLYDDDGGIDNSTYIQDNYCAMNLMMDEAIGNLTCILERSGYSENTIIIISGDNGGVPATKGSNYPFKGYKGSTMRGGVSNTAIIHSRLINEDLRGTEFSGSVHITGNNNIEIILLLF